METIIAADLDLDFLCGIRAKMPVQSMRKNLI